MFFKLENREFYGIHFEPTDPIYQICKDPQILSYSCNTYNFEPIENAQLWVF